MSRRSQIAARVGAVQTVLGPVRPEELGHTQPHEHLLLDGSGPYSSSVPPELDSTATQLRNYESPIVPATYDWIRRHCLNRENLRLTDVDEARREMAWFKAAGGTTIVDSTPQGVGRDPAGLAAISRLTGVNVIMGCGWYVCDYHPPFVAEASEDELFAAICHEVAVGDPAHGIRAGMIGEIGLSWPAHHDEEKTLRAAARAQAATGAALQIHPGRDEKAPLHAIDTVRRAGGHVDRVIMSHVDRTLFSLQKMIELAATGCYVEFDLFGQESSFYPWSPIDMPNDAQRIGYLIGLIAAGHIDRLLISQDICYKVYLRQYGGPGYAHVLENVIPMMRRKGVTDAQIRAITVENPARVLTLAQPTADWDEVR